VPAGTVLEIEAGVLLDEHAASPAIEIAITTIAVVTQLPVKMGFLILFPTVLFGEFLAGPAPY
jgi:hypothetical protein